MTIAQFTRRLRGAWNHLAAIRDRIILNMALEALKALVATGDAAADRLIALSESNATENADLKTQVANFEQDAIAEVQPTINKIVAAAPEAPGQVDSNPPAGV